MNTLAAIRPDSWNFPLLLHILGAAVLVGAVLTAVVTLLTAERTAQPDVMRRIAFRSLWMVGVPAYVVLLIFLIALGLAGFAARRKSAGLGKASGYLGVLLLIAFVVVIWAMGAKPD